MKNFMIILMIAFYTMSLTSCSLAQCNADEEIVFVKKPVMFGSGGVDEVPLLEGSEWTVASTDAIIFKITPVQYQENLDDIISNENTPLDFNTFITLQIEKGKTPILLKHYGEKWYTNNIKEVYRNMTCHYVSQYSPFDLTSNREVIAKIDSLVHKGMVSHIAKLSEINEMPIKVIKVITGKARPNDKQLNEMNNTAAQIQAKQTQERRYEMEVAREQAEKQRARSDKAYQTEMNLNADQFIQLKAWDVIKEKEGANIDVLFNSDATSKMWNVRR